jgi:hypothetical protein
VNEKVANDPGAITFNKPLSTQAGKNFSKVPPKKYKTPNSAKGQQQSKDDAKD